MKSCDPIRFDRPLRDVRLLTRTPPEDWREHLREREEAAYQRGRQDGERSLSEQLLRQRNEVVTLQQGVLSSLRRAVPQVIHEAGSALVDLALEAARKMVAGLPINAELVEAIVREAVRQVETTAEVVVQLHADDLALLRENDSLLLRGEPDAGKLRFSVSTGVGRGECLVQTDFGIIDARRQTKLEQIRDALSR